MAGTAPDTTTTFNLNGVAATDVALQHLLGTAPGKSLRVGPEHMLAETSVGTALHGGTVGADTLLIWDRSAWLALHALNISELAGLPANWMLRPGFLSQFLADLCSQLLSAAPHWPAEHLHRSSVMPLRRSLLGPRLHACVHMRSACVFVLDDM